MMRFSNGRFRVSGIALALFSLGILFNSPVYAQEDEIQRLQKKISELENRIVDLESLLVRYETKEKIDEDKSIGWENKKNWRKLKVGMKQEEVQAILGKPIKAIEGVRILWYYPNLYCGLVTFDEKGNLAGWNEP